MRLKKIAKVTALVIASLVMILFLLVTALVYNPLEGSLAAMGDVVPRNVDFYVRKVGLLADFGSRPNDFPNPPLWQDIQEKEYWKFGLKNGDFYQSMQQAGIERSLQEVERASKDMQNAGLHILKDVLGQEVQVAGRLGSTGLQGSKWCAYTRVSIWVRLYYGLMAYGMVRDKLEENGISLQAEGEHYVVTMPGQAQPMYLAKHLDCLMVANDIALLQESLALAAGADEEGLSTSAHIIENVEIPLKEWSKRSDVDAPNNLRFHLRVDQLLARFPGMQNWPDPRSEDRRNERMLASFVNPRSWKFLSGSLIFEPNSFSLLSNLVVNDSVHTAFQRELFKSDAMQRKEWMGSFFGMVPKNVCAAAALRMPPGDFLREMYQAGLNVDEQDLLNQALSETGEYKSILDLVDKMQLSFMPRIGIVFQPNVRDDDFKRYFPVNEESPMPQWAWVFWVRESSGRGLVLNQSLNKFITTLASHRGAFAFSKAYKLDLGLGQGDGSSGDVAYEFANPHIPGTGCLALCTYRQFFIVSNSGPLISNMVKSRLGTVDSLESTTDFKTLEADLPEEVNGLLYLQSKPMRQVLQQAREFLRQGAGPMDQGWAISMRPRVEREVLQQPAFSQYKTVSSVPAELGEQFQEQVDKALDQRWLQERAGRSVQEVEAVNQAIHLTDAFRSASLMMNMDPRTLQLGARVLAPEYR